MRYRVKSYNYPGDKLQAKGEMKSISPVTVVTWLKVPYELEKKHFLISKEIIFPIKFIELTKLADLGR